MVECTLVVIKTLANPDVTVRAIQYRFCEKLPRIQSVRPHPHWPQGLLLEKEL